MRTLAHRLAHRLGRRGAALLWFALLDLVYGVSLLDPRSWPRGPQAQTAFQVVRDVAPYQAWAVVWLAVGLCCLVQAWQVRDRVAFGLAIALKIAWGSCFLGSWLLHDAYRGFLSVAIWYSLAAFVGVIAGWPEASVRQGTRRGTRRGTRQGDRG